MTQEQLGLEAGLERNFISLLELGQRQPTLTSLFNVDSFPKLGHFGRRSR